MYFYKKDATKVVLYEVRPYRLDACWYLFVFINIGYFFLGFFSKKYKADFGKQAFLTWLSKRVPWWTNATVYPPGTTFEVDDSVDEMAMIFMNMSSSPWW